MATNTGIFPYQRMIKSVLRAYDFQSCHGEGAINSPRMRRLIIKAVEESGFRIMRRSLFGFIPWLYHVSFCSFREISLARLVRLQSPFIRHGYTFVAVLSESSLVIHTWTETDTAHVTLEYCNFTRDNTDKRKKLILALAQLFRPEKTVSIPVADRLVIPLAA